MSGGNKRNQDKINTITIVMVGVCGAVLVYVSIALLQAFYAADTAAVATQAEYGGQDTQALSLKSEQLANLSQVTENGSSGTFSIPIERGMALVLADAKKDPSTLIPALGRSDRATAKAKFGRPEALGATPKVAAPAPAPAPDPGGTARPGGSGGAHAGSGRFGHDHGTHDRAQGDGHDHRTDG